ncbi:MAG: carboxypeptidase [Methylotenera sp.]|nr:carboxypeptidase [Oligoflexia bacterium]
MDLRLARSPWIFLSSLLLATVAAIPAQAAVDHQKAATRQYSDVQVFLRELVKSHPKQVQLFTIGQNEAGDAIEGVKIGSGAISNLVVSTHHGNEYGSTEVALAVADSLAQNPLKGQAVFVIPVLNVSGYNHRVRWEILSGHSWDPNRNYPGPCGTEGPFTLKSTQALASFIDHEKIVTSATLHTFHPAVVYPWGMGTPDLSTPYDDLFKEMVQGAALESKYPTGNSTELIYAANGAYEDYAFWKHGIWSILFELGFSHDPSVADVQATAQVNVPGIRRMLEQAPRTRAEKHGFSGTCDDSRKSMDRHDE